MRCFGKPATDLCHAGVVGRLTGGVVVPPLEGIELRSGSYDVAVSAETTAVKAIGVVGFATDPGQLALRCSLALGSVVTVVVALRTTRAAAQGGAEEVR